MDEPRITENTRIQVETLDEVKFRFLSRIVRMDEFHITIEKPTVYDSMDGEKLGNLVGSLVRVSFSVEEGEFAFDSTVEGMPNATSYLLARPRRFYRWTRQFLRVETSLWVRYAVIPRVEMAGKVDKPKRAYAMTANISGGGVLLRSEEKLPIGTLLEMEVEVPGMIEPVLSIGRVVHTKSGNGIEFLLIDNNDRDKLIKFLFEEDRKRIRELKSM